MKTRLLTGVAVVLITLSNTALAEKAHHKDDDSKQPMPGMMQSDGMPMMDMKAMHEHMARMQETMDRIHGSSNTKEQQKLMQQHMQEMHEGMGMMQGMMSGPMGDKQIQGKMPGQMGGKQMQGKMRERMDMMQGMMGQMMQHMMQQQKMGMESK